MSVREVVETAHRLLPELRVHYGSESTHHETYLLKLDISRAQALLDWHPLWSTEEAIRRTLAPWQSAGRGEHASRSVCEQDILDYMNAVPETGS
jgi:nucleoside-diphosphate-sugar epimerase